MRGWEEREGGGGKVGKRGGEGAECVALGGGEGGREGGGREGMVGEGGDT